MLELPLLFEPEIGLEEYEHLAEELNAELAGSSRRTSTAAG